MRPFRTRHSTLDTRHSPLRRPAAAGVTLVEVVIAIFVLTVGVLGIISLFPAGYSLGQQAFDRSVASLAARDALARIMAEARRNPTGFYPDPTSASEGICYYNVPERERVGTVNSVSTHSFTAATGIEGWPSSWDSSHLAGYYAVMTSGAAAGRAYLISGSSFTDNSLPTHDVGTLTFYSSGADEVEFRTTSGTTGERVRVGDHFAIIGSKTGTCSNGLPLAGRVIDSVTHDAFLTIDTSPANRTVRVATHGASPRSGSIPWEYSYGCIITAPSAELANICRVDVFVYRGFDPTGTLAQQTRPAGHFVTYISRLDDYDNP